MTQRARPITRSGSLRPTPAHALSAMGGVWAMSETGRLGVQGILGSAIAGEVSAFLQAADMERVKGRAAQLAKSPLWRGDEDWFDPYVDPHVRESGVGVLPIRGALMTRGWWCWQGYDQIVSAGRAMLETRGLRAIVMPIDSPGGACAGAHETAAEIRAWRSVVPVYAVVDHDACSAATWLAAQASGIYVGPGSTFGHIGAWSDWWDMTEYLRAQGIRHGYTSRGRLKTFFAADDTQTTPEEQDAKRDAVMQPILQGFYDLMLADIAAGRGDRMSVDAARATEAQIYMGEAAIAAGLADYVGTYEEVIEALEELATASAQEVGR